MRTAKKRRYCSSFLKYFRLDCEIYESSDLYKFYSPGAGIRHFIKKLANAIRAGLIFFMTALIMTGCAPIDESTIVFDDNGFEHRTLHYLSDRRGRNDFPVQIAPTGKKRFIFDPQAYAWAAYDAEGYRVLTGGASGGKDFCEDIGESCRTVSGSFRVYRKKGEDCRSGEYPIEEGGGAKMPYCMYFFRGITIHAAYEVPRANSSHGCVRVLPSAAKWLNENFVDINTEVIVMDYAPQVMEMLQTGLHPEITV